MLTIIDEIGILAPGPARALDSWPQRQILLGNLHLEFKIGFHIDLSLVYAYHFHVDIAWWAAKDYSRKPVTRTLIPFRR